MHTMTSDRVKAGQTAAAAVMGERSPEVKIRLDHVGITLKRGKDATPVLQDIDLEVRAGEFICLLGPSGCGKSTLLNIIAGFLSPGTGTVTIDGKTVDGPDPRRIFVFQERGVFPWLTVEGNVGFGLFKQTREEREERVARYVKLVGLEGFEKSYPGELSGGMKQRLEVARALAVDPDMLLMDEPFSALDSITRLSMRSELLRIWRAERKTILFVTHDIDEAIQLADRIVLLSARPATVQQVVTIDLRHPRDTNSTHYLACRAGLAGQIGLSTQI